MYCKRCNYPLVGLAEHRCPECGRAFDPGSPRSFRKRPVGRFRRFLIRTGFAFAAIIVLGFVLEYGVNRAYLFESCSRCGARSTVHEFHFYGIGGEYNRVVDAGPTSQFIQARMGKPCDHQWEMSSESSASILYRLRATGRGFRRYYFTQTLDRFATADELKELFDHHAAEDPTFAERFTQTVRRPTFETESQIWNELVESIKSQSGIETP